MVFHVGICPWLGEISVYNSIDGSSFDAEIDRVLQRDADKIDFMFDIVKAVVDGSLGYACICLYSAYGNEIRKKFIELGLKHGFEKVEIIDRFTAEYLSAVTQAKLKKDGIIWIFDGKFYHLWDKRYSVAKYVGNIKGNVTKQEFDDILTTKKITKTPSAILYKKNSEINKSILNVIYIDKLVAYNFQKWSICALKKFKISATNPERLSYEANCMLEETLFVKIKDEKIMTFEAFLSLPITKWIKIISCESDLTVHHSDKQLEVIPTYENTLFTFTIDENGIYSYKWDSLTDYYPKDQQLNELKYKIKQLDDAVFEFRKSYYFPKQEIKDFRGIFAVGIDLGNTTCCTAVNRRNGFETVPIDTTGQRILPSWVSYDEKQEKCGQIVLNRLRYHEKSSASISKSKNTTRNNENMIKDNFKIQFSSSKGMMAKYPEEITAILLNYIKKKAEEFQGKTITDAVIAVPTLCDIKQREAIYVAALLAGFQEVILLKESIAITISYFVNQQVANNSCILLFHLGGGNLNISLLKIQLNCIEILESNNYPNLGAKYLDDMLFAYFNKKLADEYGIVLPEDKKYKLMMECQQIKHSLSCIDTARLDVEDFDVEKDGYINITRGEFEKMSMSYLTSINDVIHSFIIPHHEIKTVLYAGGGTRMPIIKSLLESTFYSAVHLCDDIPEEIVAKGAAYYASCYKSQILVNDEKYFIPKYPFNKKANYNVIGIRLGTTNCYAAVDRQRGIETVALDNKGERLLPSYVAFDEEHEKCGKIVIDRLRYNAKSSVYDLNKIMGKKLEDLITEKNWSFKILQENDAKNVVDDSNLKIIKDSKVIIQLKTAEGETVKHPEEITAALLKHIKCQTEMFQGQHLSAAVISIPSRFSKAEKEAYYVAALLAGWEIIHFLPDPIAALFGYFVEYKLPLIDTTVLIFDLGGSTLDISVLKIKNMK